MLRGPLIACTIVLAVTGFGAIGCGGDDGPSEADVVEGKLEEMLNDPGEAGEDYDPNPQVTGCEEDSELAGQTDKDAWMCGYDPGNGMLPPGETMGVGVCVVDGRIEDC